jgi:F-type H+-transporting ATPase subunit delta
MSTETIARRYSSALADVALKQGEAETIKTELAMFEQLVAGNADLANALSNPAIPHSKKENILEELISRTKPSKTTSNFLRVLLQNSRLIDLKDIRERFETELIARSGVVAAQVTTARELPASERGEVESSIAKLTGKRVNVDYLVDPDLIGGLVTRIGSTVYDGSVKTKLENLKEQLVTG